mgnify:CR=1 FL=1
MAKDYTKYTVDGIDGTFNKARLVQTIVTHYLENNTMLWDTILATFPHDLQGKKGVICKALEVEKDRDFYVDAPITLKDGTKIVSCRQWGKHNIVYFIERAASLGYVIKTEGEESKREDTLSFTKEQINTIINATYFYEIEQVLAEVSGVEPHKLQSLKIEPYLTELLEDNTFDGIENELPNFEIVQTINKVYGNLCYLSYYDEEGKGDKTCLEYAELWGSLLKLSAKKAIEASEYRCLGDACIEQFTPFENKDEMQAFAHLVYEKAIDLDTDIGSLTLLVNRLESEYYRNSELLDKLSDKVLRLSKSFQDYALICFNDNQENLFPQEVFNQALDKVIELKEEAQEDELENLIELMTDDEDLHGKIKQLDPDFTPPNY